MRRLVDDDFFTIFDEFERTAYRLETLPHYDVPFERDAYAKFVAGQPFTIDWHQAWLARMHAATAAGKAIQRVRVMSDPPTLYQQFELTVTPHNIAVGESIRILDESTAERLALSLPECWLFDDVRAVVMAFDDGGRFQYADVTEDSVAVDPCRTAWDTAWRHAKPYEAYAADHPEYTKHQGTE